jgi:hypothetical protein
MKEGVNEIDRKPQDNEQADECFCHDIVSQRPAKTDIHGCRPEQAATEQQIDNVQHVSVSPVSPEN